MTREEELIRIAKKLDKMVSRKTTEGAMDLLRELKSFNMTLKLLQETRIGVSVNNIRKHCTDEEVITLAKVLIKDWKRLLDSGQPHSEKPSGMKNGLDPTQAAGSPSSSPSDTQSSHSGLDVKLKQDPDKNRKEKHNAEQRGKKRPITDLGNEKHLEEPQNKKHPPEIRREKHPEESNKQRAVQDSWLEIGNKTQIRVRELQTEKHEPDERKERVKKGKHPVEPKSPDDVKRDRDENRHERLINTQQRQSPLTEPQREKPTDVHRPLFERRGVLDSSILYPTRFPSPPRPSRPPLPIKRPSLDQKKDRKDGKDSFPQYPHPQSPPSSSTPPPRRPSMDVKKERRIPPDPNAPIAPLPLHLHPPPPRKAPPDPNAPLPPLPLHLHPPPPPKRPSVDERSESRRESSDSKPPSQKKKTLDHLKKDRKDLSYSKISKKHSDDGNRDRKDSVDTKPPVPKKLSEETQKEKHRKDSCDSKPAQIVKRHSADFKPDRRESADSKKSSSSPAKKLTAERRESHGSRTSQSGPPQRKLSTDSSERRAKPDVTKSPTTPTSPISPSFTSAGGSLAPHLTTGDSIRDKCIEMLAAALRTDDDYKEFSTNCESMAAEIEDHIYQEIKATDMKYKNRVRSRISNLKDPKNPGLRKNVLAGTIALSQIASMSAEEMASDELKQLRNTLTQEAIREHQMAKTGGTTTDLLQCSKCKKKNCTYNQVQTRSADEPMTTFVLCNECGNRWKFC